MAEDASKSGKVIDMHCHVGVLGDEHPEWGAMQDWFRDELVYRVFLLYAGIKPDELSDGTIREKTVELISGMVDVKQVVCLALDPVYDDSGDPRPERSPMWVSNDYVLHLRSTKGLEDRVLFGASVHPYARDFQDRVRRCVDEGAVLLKWLPSTQQFNLADERVRDALLFLATVRDGKPLPLLLHSGREYALESSDRRTQSYDYLCWTWWDKLRNRLRGAKKWHRPDLGPIHRNLQAGLQEGATIIFAHCGLPYYAPNWLKRVLEHSDLAPVRRYLQEYPADGSAGGRCYADVSACATPFRRSYYNAIKQLPPESLLFGSDYPTPVFELWRDGEEWKEDMTAIMRGDVKRIAVPEDNLLDVNYLQLEHFFPGHAMFTNFGELL